MKYGIAIASLMSIVTVGHAIAQAQPLSYADIVREARRYEKLEGGERVTSNSVLFKKVRLNLHAFGKGSDAYFVNKADEIAFTCTKTAPGFKSGIVVGTVTKHEEGAEGSHVYTIDNCAVTK